MRLNTNVMHFGDVMFSLRPILIMTLIVLQGCSILGYDHREKIAMSAVYHPNGHINERVFTLALHERLTESPSPIMLKVFTESLGGRCTNQPGIVTCHIPQTGTICFATYIEITANVSAGIITEMQVEQKTDGC